MRVVVIVYAISPTTLRISTSYLCILQLVKQSRTLQKIKIFAPLAKSHNSRPFRLARKSARNKDWNFVSDTEPKIGVLMEGAPVCGFGELVGGKQGREIFSGVAASSPPPCGEG